MDSENSSKKTILLVEDEEAMQKTFSEILQEEGYTVLSAMNGEDGFEMAKSNHPDLIMLDLILPRKDGFEVLKLLKATEETKQIPVVILTNLEGSSDVEKALELGATTYLVKANYSLEEVVKKVRSLIG